MACNPKGWQAQEILKLAGKLRETGLGLTGIKSWQMLAGARMPLALGWMASAGLAGLRAGMWLAGPRAIGLATDTFLGLAGNHWLAGPKLKE